MKAVVGILVAGLVLSALPVAGAEAVANAREAADTVRGAAAPVVAPVLRELPLAWCQAVECGPFGALYVVAGAVDGGANPNDPGIVWCASLECGPTGPLYRVTRDATGLLP